jgi:hypothetical protein
MDRYKAISLKGDHSSPMCGSSQIPMVVPGFFAERKADHSVSGVRVGEDLSSLRSSC